MAFCVTSKKADPERVGSASKKEKPKLSPKSLYFECGAADPLAGGQGAGEEVPGLVEVPGVPEEPEFEEPELDEPEFDVPELDELDDVFGVVLPLVPGAAPGIFPQGPPLGLVCGLFGLTLEGWVLLPGVGGLGEFDPGTVPGVGLGVFGVDVLPGGVAVPPDGVVVPPGAAWPAAPADPLGAAPPAGALCAITQTAQNRSVESKASFVADI